ncbi:fimbrial protein [Providencia burhodogranariea]|uniref:Fimbrial subunit n=1 Tax=Providencia burhodogranariea DSM 19968 TaxID=1141662 RepID=K8W9C3_9GAMM|nr:fimbrial protein [Providencia burhodogranariea]EKT57154.1 fimbrial subunit [Providencia burhodogranariea DSM 19968]
MKHITILFSLLIYSAFTSADAVNINVSGYVAAMPCEIERNNYSIDLKKVNAWNIRDSQVSPWVDFSIKFKNCPTKTTQVIMTITGTSDLINGDYFINTGTSKNSALNLVNTLNKTLIKNGTKIIVAVDNNSRSVEIPLSARIVGYGNGMSVGTFRSHVEFTLLYN